MDKFFAVAVLGNRKSVDMALLGGTESSGGFVSNKLTAGADPKRFVVVGPRGFGALTGSVLAWGIPNIEPNTGVVVATEGAFLNSNEAPVVGANEEGFCFGMPDTLAPGSILTKRAHRSWSVPTACRRR
jgi:hypothetical protein